MLRCLEFLFKFIVRSQQLYLQLGDGDPASYFQPGVSFESSIGQFFISIEHLMSEKDNTSLTAQGAVLQYLPTIVDQLTMVFSPFQLTKLLVQFVENIGFKNSSNERLIESRIKCIIKIIETDLFSNLPDCQELLLQELSDQVVCLLDDNIQMEVTSALLQNLIDKVSLSPPSQRVILSKLLHPLMGRLKSFLRTSPEEQEDEVGQVVPSLNSSLLAIVRILTESSNYEWYLKSQNLALRRFLDELFQMIELIVTSPLVYPKPWLQLKLLASRTILGVIKATSRTLFAHFLSRSDFSAELWSAFFSVSIAFLGQDFLQLEHFVPIKRLKILEEFGDMRQGRVQNPWLALFYLAKHNTNVKYQF